jgi:DNA-directed RNA polymerase III subunit RPC5
LHLHPISETHQLRPTLTYLDVLSRKSKRSKAGEGTDSESDEGPPPDPDEPVLPPIPSPKKDKKSVGEAKEVQVSARKSDENKGGMQPFQGGLSTVRREMLSAIRAEDDEMWEDLEFCGGEVWSCFQILIISCLFYSVQTEESAQAFEAIFSRSGESLECKTELTAFLNDISGLG